MAGGATKDVNATFRHYLFGMSALAVALPVSTAIMLRSVAEIARQEGENLDDIEVRLACVSVLARSDNRP
jgi:hypothetical protein